MYKLDGQTIGVLTQIEVIIFGITLSAAYTSASTRIKLNFVFAGEKPSEQNLCGTSLRSNSLCGLDIMDHTFS